MGQVLSEQCCGGETGADATSDVVPGLAKPGEIGMKPPPKAAAPPTAASPTPASPVPVPSGDSISADAVKNLKDMGFDEVAARNALEACNGNLDQATQLLLSSAAEAEPTPVVQAPAAHVEALSEKVATLVGMGFTEKQAKDALDGCSGNVERAAEYLLSSA